MTEVKDQGDCKASWAFAVVAYFESLEIIFGNNDTSLDLSEQYLLECTEGSSCAGGSINSALLAIEDGIPT